MEKKLTARIAAMYMPCKITDNYSNGVHYDMVGVSEHESMLQCVMPSGDTDWWNIDICQLVLKPLPEISPEHAIAAAKILEYPDSEINDSQVLTEDIVAHLDEAFTGNCATYADYVSGNTFIELTNFLRKHSYDVDGLIQKGIAIADGTDGQNNPAN